MNRVSPPSRTTASRLTVSKYSSNLAQSWPPGASLNSLDHSLQVYLTARSITASKFARLQPPSVSRNSLDCDLQVNPQTRSITAYKYIIYRATPPVWRYMGNGGGMSEEEYIFRRPRSRLASTYHAMKIHTLSFPTFGLTRSVRDMVDPRNRLGSSTPCIILSSHPIPTLLKLGPLFLKNSAWTLREVRRSVLGGLSAF